MKNLHNSLLLFYRKMLSNTNELNGMTLLHYVVRYDPPLEVVAKMIQICPDSPSARDCLNRTPLHVAVGVDAPVDIIKYLAISYPKSCNIQDGDGCTPLHLACNVESRLFEEEEHQRGPPSFDVVYTLLSVSIAPALIEDNDECSPLEYAITNEAEQRVVKILQQAAQKYNRERQHGHATVRQSRKSGAVA